ncbi:MAG: TIGR03862 family flavoprotein [Nonlabens sp.]|uniref:NAD(P)/FAD-dependent oxidoreductase n=1 Tax=Nonlabens sp. TaxID=1888209 RepID=UPI00321ADBC9
MRKKVAIIGGGPSAFMLAAILDPKKFKVTIYEKNKTSGRKFLVAGKGGFNLTHSESMEQLVQKYTPHNFLEAALLHFNNVDFRNWLDQIGIPTYIGSSKRVYPKKGIKPIEVLKAVLKHLKEKSVKINYEHRFTGWNEQNQPIVNDTAIASDYTIFCLGGASWKVTGSTGNWLDVFSKKEIKTKSFQASNCAYDIHWKGDFIKGHEGTPLKNIAIYCNEYLQKGEAVITKSGLEGNAIYGLSPQIRQQLHTSSKALIYVDFKPSLSLERIQEKIEQSIYSNTTRILKKELRLTAAQIDLLKLYLSKDQYLNNTTLSQFIKKFPLEITGSATIDEAISTVGGISLNAITENYELIKLPHQFCIGEMLDWDAPTGGYLLQGCMSMGSFLGAYLNEESY